MAEVEKQHKFNKKEEERLVGIVFANEYSVALSGKAFDVSEFESCIALFNAERSEKNYDWRSDISTHEFTAHIFTQMAADVGQYFQTRDFVEVYIEDEGDEANKSAEATQECLNRTLNRRNLYHYPKFVRAKSLNTISGRVYAKCYWEQEISTETNYSEGEFGEEVEHKTETIEKDQFNYEVLDERNVFESPEYTYSLQDKAWVIVRGERTIEALKREAKQEGYFNLDIIEADDGAQTETEKATTAQDKPETVSFSNTLNRKLDILWRYGRFWVMEDGKIGVDETGKVKAGAVLKEMVVTLAVSGGTKTLIGFMPAKTKDADGVPYRPIIRGLCYIHPTEDGGVGDGKYARDLQIGIDDTLNIGCDRTMLATLPVFKGKKYVTEDTDSIYIEPEHLIELEDPATDLVELQISDNVQGAMMQIAVLTEKMQQLTAKSPGSMGNLPPNSSTPATLGAIAEQRGTQRDNYKSMTFEYTFLTELYWIAQQMTFQFAKEETAFKLMGDKLYDFNPALNYTYKPLSQSIETESSKGTKVRNLTQILGYVSGMDHPDAAKMVNLLVFKILTLMGDESVNIIGHLLDPKRPMEGQEGVEAQGGMGGGPSNEQMIPQSSGEVDTRQAAGGGFY